MLMRHRGNPVVWLGVVLLVAIGVTSVVARAIHPADSATRMEPLRTRILEGLDRPDPLADQRPAELARFDGRFAEHRSMTLLHILPGGLFLLLAPLQFVKRIRQRHIRLHRWSGRALIVCAFAATVPALYFGLLMPFGGALEALAMALVGGWFMLSLGRAYGAIRRKQVARHRVWMIRAFGTAIGISMVRVAALVIELTLVPYGISPATLFVLSIWSGFGLSIAGAELWIRKTSLRSVELQTGENRELVRVTAAGRG